MHGPLGVVVWILVALIVVGVVMWGYVNVRANKLTGQVGSFRAWSRPDTASGWTSGIGMYGVETLTWYRLVGFSYRPVYTLPRRGLEISTPIQHSNDGTVVEIRVKYQEHRYELAVAEQTYNGLVSWIESGPPSLR